MLKMMLKAKKAEKPEKLVEMFCSSQLRSPADEWTVEDEETLRKLQDTDNIQLAKTEVKRQKAVMKQHVFAAGIDPSNEEWEKLTKLWKNKLGKGDK